MTDFKKPKKSYTVKSYLNPGLNDAASRLDRVESILETIQQEWVDSDYTLSSEAIRSMFRSFDPDTEIDAIEQFLSGAINEALQKANVLLIYELLDFIDFEGIFISDPSTILARSVGFDSFGNFTDIAASAAIKEDDLELLKKIEEFNRNKLNGKFPFPRILKNISLPENLFEPLFEMTSAYRPLATSKLLIYALLIGSKSCYEYIKTTNSSAMQIPTNFKERLFDYTDKLHRLDWLSGDMVDNTIELEPSWINEIFESYPEFIPDAVKDIFIF